MGADSFALGAAIAVLSLLALGFFAVGGFVVSGLTRGRYLRLLEEAPELAQPIGDFVERQSYYQLAFGAARTISVVLATYGATLLDPSLNELGVVVLWACLVASLLLSAHVLPRLAVGTRFEEVARALSLPIRLAGVALAPLAFLLHAVLGLRVRLDHRATGAGEASKPASEELRDLIGERVVEESEREMIDGIFELEETTAREIMVPRMDVAALPRKATVKDALDIVIGQGYSRLPVYDLTIDNVVGVLYAKDLFPVVLTGGLGEEVGKHLRPAYFIPESKKIDDLLAELQARRVHIAIVVDEYGGTAGLVTIEDLLEEIVGEIQDEFDAEEDKIVAGAEGEAIFDATVSIDDVNQTLGLVLEGEEVDTIGGLVYEKLGKVPLVGDELVVDGATISVVSTSGRRIRRVRVSRAVSAEDDSDGTQ